MAVKKDKLAGIIQRELSQILQMEIRNSAIGMCSVTGVDLTNDLSLATIYVSFIASNSKKKAMEALDKSKGYIRTLLSKRLSIRKVPDLKFKLDTSLEYGNHIESILKDINKD